MVQRDSLVAGIVHLIPILVAYAVVDHFKTYAREVFRYRILLGD